MIKFEKDLIVEAQAYAVEASKRLVKKQGERKTTRKSLAEIYKKMKEVHPRVIEQHYRIPTYKLEEKDLTFKSFKLDYPDNFKRYFFRLIKTLNGKKPGAMKNMEVYRGARRLPTTFMVAGTSKRCTIHEFGCPEEDCPHRTHNKKIVMTSNLAKKNAAKTIATRTRVFYRDDYKKEMKNIFMSQDDQLNCRFEPTTGSLNPRFWSIGPIPQKLETTAETEAQFNDKHGENLKKTHPEIYKKGVLKKAQGEFKKGEFSKSMNTLMQAFKIKSLRMHFDPKYRQKMIRAADKK